MFARGAIMTLLNQNMPYVCLWCHHDVAASVERQACFVPTLSDDAPRPDAVLDDYLGDWKAPSKKDSPRELDVGAHMHMRNSSKFTQ